MESFVTKYKPYHIKDFRLHADTVLEALLEMDHLFLLICGNPGTGKTMLLEALIRDYYKLDKKALFPENDVLYINNLKEQGVSFYRNEMKTFCQSRSLIPGRKKLIVIDDIDNVNEQSQQVFRNYIDRYQENINFLAVCTNMQKVIESIQSRMYIIQLHSLTERETRMTMDMIIEKEGLAMDEACKSYLIAISNQSIRNMINCLEKLHILHQPIDLALCKNVCSAISSQHFEDYLDAYHKKDLHRAIAIFYDLFYSGYSVIDILDFFFQFLKITNLLDETTKYLMIPPLCKYITIFHNVHEDVIELALFTNSIFKIG